MAKEVAKASENFFEKYGRAATGRSIIGRLLRFNKFGEYRAGQDGEKIPYGTKLAVAMNTLSVGYLRWEDGRPAERIMGPICEGYVPPKRGTLGYTDKSKWDSFDDGQPNDPWQFTNEVVLANLENGELFTFSTASNGGLSAIGELCKKHGEHIRQHPDEVPIIELEMGSYMHSNRAYGEIRVPILKRVGWVSEKKLPPIDGADGQQQIEAPDGDSNGGDGGDDNLLM
jgi:hypothetical protein